MERNKTQCLSVWKDIGVSCPSAQFIKEIFPPAYCCCFVSQQMWYYSWGVCRGCPCPPWRKYSGARCWGGRLFRDVQQFVTVPHNGFFQISHDDVLHINTKRFFHYLKKNVLDLPGMEVHRDQGRVWFGAASCQDLFGTFESGGVHAALLARALPVSFSIGSACI